MEAKPTPAKAPLISALRCLSPECRALLAYEVTKDDFLYNDLSWTARQEGDLRYFPCPKCHGKNVLEAVADPKGTRYRVSRWQA